MALRTDKSQGASDIARPTVIEFILDETGSMSSHHRQVVAGYNTFITEQKNVDGQGLLTLTKFDTSGQKTPFVDLDLNMVVPMTMETFVPGGGTNLRDTIGRRVRQTETRLGNWATKPNVLVIVMTDGADTSSHEYSPAQVRDLIAAHEAKGWTFVFLGACSSALKIAADLGFQTGNTKQFDKDHMEQTMTTLSSATTVYRSSRAHTAASSNSYFAN